MVTNIFILIHLVNLKILYSIISVQLYVTKIINNQLYTNFMVTSVI